MRTVGRRRLQQLICVLSFAAAGQCAQLPARAGDCTAEEAAAAEKDYSQALADYRAGRVAASLLPMRSAFARCPENVRHRYDFIEVAASAGDAEESLAAGASLNPRDLPDYVLRALGRAARDTRQPDLAARYYEVILNRGTEVGAAVGRDLAWIDRGNAREAQADLKGLDAKNPNRIDVLEALGLANESLGEVMPALAAAEAVLGIDAQHRGALTLRFRMLMRSGAPQLALELTPVELLSPAQRVAALQDTLALDFRWTRDEPGTDKARAARLDSVIGRMRTAMDDPTLDAHGRTGLRGDLVEALAERGSAAAAVREYERLLADGIPIPPYVTVAVVGAYLTQKQPQRALVLYRSLPPGDRASFALRVNVCYALLESGRYAAALAWADELAAEQPLYRDASSPALRRGNGDYVSTRVLAALARDYTDRPADAERRLMAILDLAPANREARLALAETQAMRGWPRLASETATGVLQERPGASGPLRRLFEDDLQMSDFHRAQRTLGEMTENLPGDDAGLLRAQRDWQTHEKTQVGIDGQIGRSSGRRAGIVDSSVEEYGYSPPIEVDYRAFVHLNQAEGTPVQGATFRHAVGAGVEYHTRNWLATAELLEIDHHAPSPQVSIESTPDDYWKLGASFAVRTLDVPLAAVVVGVHANRAALSLGYRASEARDFAAALSHERFSDGNSRTEWLGSWHARWITGPVYELDTRLDLDGSSNTLTSTNYFNPGHDFTGTATLQNQWLQFRRYDRALTHEIDLGLGDYLQQGNGAGLVALLRYQLVFECNDRLTLKAGIGRTVRPYDGARERLDVLKFNFLGRF